MRHPIAGRRTRIRCPSTRQRMPSDALTRFHAGALRHDASPWRPASRSRSRPPVTSSEQPACTRRWPAASIHFTGDLGRICGSGDAPARSPGNLGRARRRVHLRRSRALAGRSGRSLEDVIARTTRQGGVVLIPAFAVGRTESVLLQLAKLRQAGRLPDVPIFLNSPMAIEVADIYHRHPEEHRLTATRSTSCTASRRRSTRSTSRSCSTSAAGP